jgi:hypothetical protein
VFPLLKEKTTATRIFSLLKTLKKDLAKLQAKRKFNKKNRTQVHLKK